jgi:hypothetical protein
MQRAYCKANPNGLVPETAVECNGTFNGVLPGFLRDLIDIPQDFFYLEYWGSYEAIKGVNGLAQDCGPVAGVCSAAAHVLTAPGTVFEAEGLAGDVLGNLLKGESIWQQGTGCQPLFGNETGGPELSQWLAGVVGSNWPTNMTFPGLTVYHKINFAW